MQTIKFNKQEIKNPLNEELNEAIRESFENVNNINTKVFKKGEKVILIKDDTKEN